MTKRQQAKRQRLCQNCLEPITATQRRRQWGRHIIHDRCEQTLRQQAQRERDRLLTGDSCAAQDHLG